MKHFNKYILGLATLTAAIGFVSCEDDFDDKKPAFGEPKATITANTSILDFKKAYWQSDKLNYVTKVEAKENGDRYIVAGRVISSDRAGNVYKKLVIADESAALPISINANSLYNDYRVGQEIVIDLTDMYVGKYCGSEQLGWPDVYDKTGEEQTSFMPLVFFQDHAQLNGFPAPSEIDTLTIRKFSDLPSSPEEIAAMQSRLVRFNNVHFTGGGTMKFANAYKETTNRELLDADGQSLTVRTSGYANFRDEIMPEGSGDVVGILDYYQTSLDSSYSPWQLTLIDSGGCSNFGNPTLTPGEKTNPYTIAQLIEVEQAAKSERAWVKGFIVGAVAPEVTEVKGDDDIEWSADVVLANTLVVAPTADCKDWTKVAILPLPQDTPLREKGNLRDNPGNYGKAILVFGSFEKYMSTWGITGNSGAASQFEIDGVEVSGGEIAAGDGTEASPLNVAQVIALNPTSTTEAAVGGSQVWVKGYIVGYMPTGGSSTTLAQTVFAADANAATTNLVIGPTPDCAETAKCVSVQLPSGTIRSALNLHDNPANLGKAVALFGDVMKYCGAPGVKNASKYVLDGSEGGDTPTPPGPSGDGDGTADKPFNAAQLIAFAPTSTTAAPEGGSNIFVEGYIVGYMPTGGSSTTLSKTVFAADVDAATTNIVVGPTADCADPSICFGVQLPTESVSPGVRSGLNLKDNPGNIGKKVVLQGDVMKYCGAPGLKNTKSYTLSGEGGDTPTPPTPSAAEIYKALAEGDAALTEGWTIDNVNLGSLSRVWSWKEYSGKYYLNGSGYSGSAVACEAYAVSPVIDLTGVTEAAVAFDHAAKFQTTLRTLCGLVVREEGATGWTMLTIPTWPEAGSWAFANSGSVDLSAYNGKKIQIAFKYASTAEGADTWEIKNLVVSGKK